MSINEVISAVVYEHNEVVRKQYTRWRMELTLKPVPLRVSTKSDTTITVNSNDTATKTLEPAYELLAETNFTMQCTLLLLADLHEHHARFIIINILCESLFLILM
uniref:Uncharacterized protein n=1 Tax=Rhipicephalus zambeziensis TaxID=60191 RepID=A0A224YG55_9ACAR